MFKQKGYEAKLIKFKKRLNFDFEKKYMTTHYIGAHFQYQTEFLYTSSLSKHPFFLFCFKGKTIVIHQFYVIICQHFG